MQQARAQQVINLWRICNPEGTRDYSVRYLVNKSCDGTLDSVTYWARREGSTVFEKVGTTEEVQDWGTFITVALDGAKGYEEFYIEGNKDCFGSQSISDTVLVDRFEPSVMNIRVATVEDGKVVVRWKESPEKDLMEYELYTVDKDLTSFPISRVSKSDLEFEIPVEDADPTKEAVIVRIAAVDSCELIGKPDGTAKTIFLEVESDDPCANELIVKWNDYEGKNWVKEWQKIIVSDKEGKVVRTGIVSGSINTWSLNDLPEGLFDVVIEEKKQNEDLTTRSNVIQVNRLDGIALDSFYIRSVSITDDSRIQITWHTEESKVIQEFLVYRVFDGRSDVLKKVAYKDGTSEYSATFDWIGNISEFFIEAEGICGGEVVTEISKNMLLKGDLIDDDIRRLNVTGYSTWAQGVDVYRLERRDRGLWVDLGSFGSGVASDGDLEIDLDSGWCYRAIAEGSQFKNIDERSVSNVVCLYQTFHGDIPNAFVPEGGENTIFKVNAVQMNRQESRMIIFNRWGEIVYDGIDPVNVGWTGDFNNVNGKKCPAGIYMYRLELKSLNGETYFKSGTVNLMR